MSVSDQQRYEDYKNWCNKLGLPFLTTIEAWFRAQKAIPEVPAHGFNCQ